MSRTGRRQMAPWPRGICAGWQATARSDRGDDL